MKLFSIDKHTVKTCWIVLLSCHIHVAPSRAFNNDTPIERLPNDIPGTVSGCANAILAHDDDANGVISRNEYLDLANNIADLLCLPPIPEMNFELSTVFISSACLCEELEGYETGCCFGEDAGILIQGATDVSDMRSEEQESYLRSICLLAQAVLGESECGEDVSSFEEESFSADQESIDNSSHAIITMSPGLFGEGTIQDIPGTVPGCAAVMLDSDLNRDGAIGRDEYLGFVNNVADLLCVPSKPVLDLELQTSFIGLACLCLEKEDSELDCCIADNASIDLSAVATDDDGRTIEEENYLRAVCVLTEAQVGPGNCKENDSGTLPPNNGVDTMSSTATNPDITMAVPRGSNDIPETVVGCADALLANDYDQNGAIMEGEEYLGFANNIAELLCLSPRPELDLELQTAFVSITCLCMEQEGSSQVCCLGGNAAIDIDGAASGESRTPEQEELLRAACLITQFALGPGQCDPASSSETGTNDGSSSSNTPSPTSESTADSSFFSTISDTIEIYRNGDFEG